MKRAHAGKRDSSDSSPSPPRRPKIFCKRSPESELNLSSTSQERVYGPRTEFRGGSSLELSELSQQGSTSPAAMQLPHTSVEPSVSTESETGIKSSPDSPVFRPRRPLVATGYPPKVTSTADIPVSETVTESGTQSSPNVPHIRFCPTFEDFPSSSSQNQSQEEKLIITPPRPSSHSSPSKALASPVLFSSTASSSSSHSEELAPGQSSCDIVSVESQTSIQPSCFSIITVSSSAETSQQPSGTEPREEQIATSTIPERFHFDLETTESQSPQPWFGHTLGYLSSSSRSSQEIYTPPRPAKETSSSSSPSSKTASPSSNIQPHPLPSPRSPALFSSTSDETIDPTANTSIDSAGTIEHSDQNM